MGLSRGLNICANAPSITHLLFTDDALLLLKSNRQNAEYLRYVLQLYEECSGQIVNKEKLAILFSKNTGNAAKEKFLEDLGLTHEARSDRYSGLPVYMGRSKKKVFA